jgi:hypothetical protein
MIFLVYVVFQTASKKLCVTLLSVAPVFADAPLSTVAQWRLARDKYARDSSKTDNCLVW